MILAFLGRWRVRYLRQSKAVRGRIRHLTARLKLLDLQLTLRRLVVVARHLLIGLRDVARSLHVALGLPRLRQHVAQVHIILHWLDSMTLDGKTIDLVGSLGARSGHVDHRLPDHWLRATLAELNIALLYFVIGRADAKAEAVALVEVRLSVILEALLDRIRVLNRLVLVQYVCRCICITVIRRFFTAFRARYYMVVLVAAFRNFLYWRYDHLFVESLFTLTASEGLLMVHIGALNHVSRTLVGTVSIIRCALLRSGPFELLQEFLRIIVVFVWRYVTASFGIFCHHELDVALRTALTKQFWWSSYGRFVLAFSSIQFILTQSALRLFRVLRGHG